MLPSSIHIMWPKHLRTLKLLCPMVKEIHLQKIHYLTLTPRSRSHELLPSTLNNVTYAQAKFEVATSKGLWGDVFTRKYINWPLTLTLGSRSQKNDTQYPRQYVTYAQAKFEVATSKSLWGDAFTRKYIFWPMTLTLGSRSYEMSPSTLYIMWSMHLQSLKLLRPMVKEEIQLQETWRTDGQTHGRTDGRRTDFGTKLIYPIFLTKKRV